MSGRLHIGTSGYQYDHWRGVLYPEDLPRDAWFARYAEEFDTVEINNTFYRLPSADTFHRWRDLAPDGFVAALKFSRYGTHLKKLKDPVEPLARFTGRARLLGRHLGPILVQLPPHWHADPPRLADFLDAADRDLRWAVEFRDRDWLRREVYDVLREAGAALVIHDLVDDHPVHVTADFVYLRWHGVDHGSSYSPQALSGQARRIRGFLERGIDVFAYFNNDLAGHAMHDARDLRRFVRTTRQA
ncbi:DUF72 domain-containing protein [bacterium]|nr:DUF72 domain-containing protein [bacterium]